MPESLPPGYRESCSELGRPTFFNKRNYMYTKEVNVVLVGTVVFIRRRAGHE